MASSMQPEQALFLREWMLGALRLEHPITRRVIDAIPVDKGLYRPDTVVKNADDLAWHIVGAEHRFLDAVVNGVFDLTPRPRPDELRTSADISRWYGDAFAQDVERVAAMPVEALLKVVDFRGIFQLPAVAYLHTAHIHSIHHRGQLSMYLRPMGARVPAIYGESYDSALAKSAAR
ncbi:MAG TPA: DinB family protein [Vicinamibacterales bacterium]|nr:DinB family protein [Vicinamibacterales bacterium]